MTQTREEYCPCPHFLSPFPHFLSHFSVPISPFQIETPNVTDFKGKSKKEGERILEEKGMGRGYPTQGEGGTRYDNPTKTGEQVRWMPGNPKNSNSIKQGPYWTGAKGGQHMPHVPAKGNPLLK